MVELKWINYNFGPRLGDLVLIIVIGLGFVALIISLASVIFILSH